MLSVSSPKIPISLPTPLSLAIDTSDLFGEDHCAHLPSTIELDFLTAAGKEQFSPLLVSGAGPKVEADKRQVNRRRAGIHIVLSAYVSTGAFMKEWALSGWATG